MLKRRYPLLSGPAAAAPRAYHAAMPLRLSHTQLLRYAGLFTWAVVGMPLAYFPLADSGQAAVVSLDLVGSTLAYLVFGVAYWLVTRKLGARSPGVSDILLLGLLTLSAIMLSKLTGTGLGSILLMLVSGVIPWLMPLRVAVAWLILMHVPLVSVFLELEGWTPAVAVLQAIMYVGYSSFAFITGLVARQQAEAREEQRRLNAELRATRALLAESSRMSERLRISRELHDLLGHHLTALSLNLEVAGHLAEGKAQEHVRQSHTLAKLLLTDVREAVSEMREERGIDLSHALRVLAEVAGDPPGDPAEAQEQRHPARHQQFDRMFGSAGEELDPARVQPHVDQPAAHHRPGEKTRVAQQSAVVQACKHVRMLLASGDCRCTRKSWLNAPAPVRRRCPPVARRGATCDNGQCCATTAPCMKQPGARNVDRCPRRA